MRTRPDALRSVQLHVSKVLGPEWNVTFAREEVGREMALVTTTGTTADSGTAYIREIRMPVRVWVYPDSDEDSAVAGKLEAEVLAETLKRSLTQGTHGARSHRLPFYDYDGIPWDGNLPDDAAPFDYLVIEQDSVDTDVQVDPDDDHLFTVIFDMRLNWLYDGDTSRFEGNELKEVRVHGFQPDPTPVPAAPGPVDSEPTWRWWLS